MRDRERESDIQSIGIVVGFAGVICAIVVGLGVDSQYGALAGCCWGAGLAMAAVVAGVVVAWPREGD